MSALLGFFRALLRFPANLARNIRDHNSGNISQAHERADGLDYGALEGDLREFVAGLNRGSLK